MKRAASVCVRFSDAAAINDFREQPMVKRVAVLVFTFFVIDIVEYAQLPCFRDLSLGITQFLF